MESIYISLTFSILHFVLESWVGRPRDTLLNSPPSNARRYIRIFSHFWNCRHIFIFILGFMLLMLTTTIKIFLLLFDSTPLWPPVHLVTCSVLILFSIKVMEANCLVLFRDDQKGMSASRSSLILEASVFTAPAALQVHNNLCINI